MSSCGTVNVTSVPFIAVIIACLGLFGLISFVIDQRAKEIGIRKILGASFESVIVLLSKSVGKWIIISNIISVPSIFLTAKQNVIIKQFIYLNPWTLD